MGWTKFTPARRAAFLEALGQGLSVRQAARQTGISVRCAFNHRGRDPGFAAAWLAAAEKGSIAPAAGASFEDALLAPRPADRRAAGAALRRAYSERALWALLRRRRLFGQATAGNRRPGGKGARRS